MRQGNRAVLSFRGHAGRCPPYRGAPYGRSLGKFPQIVVQAKDILEPFMDASAPIHERRLRLGIFALLLGTYRATIHADCLGYQWDTRDGSNIKRPAFADSARYSAKIPRAKPY
jgi:hypothetical protein